MVYFTLKVILHVAENDSKYRDIAPLRVNLVSSSAPKENKEFTISSSPYTLFRYYLVFNDDREARTDIHLVLFFRLSADKLWIWDSGNRILFGSQLEQEVLNLQMIAKPTSPPPPK